MKKKIFRNMLSITLIAVLLCSALILGVIYQFLSNRTWQALENEASYLLAALNRYEAVSYTHLDVYKRQAGGCGIRIPGRDPLPCHKRIR